MFCKRNTKKLLVTFSQAVIFVGLTYCWFRDESQVPVAWRGTDAVEFKEANTFASKLPLGGLSEKLLVGYWGQNGAGPSKGKEGYGKPLGEVCQTTKFDIVNLAFLIWFFDSRNKDNLPGLHFAFHCETPVSGKYKTLFRCPNIERGIKECQSRGIKVFISLGGECGDGTLFSPSKAKKFAHTLWNLFLGGTTMKKLRPFGTAVLDGVDLAIEAGDFRYYPEFIRELRALMDSETAGQKYSIAASPQCPFPSHFLGPEHRGKALTEAGSLVDYLYVRYFNNFCYLGDHTFLSTLRKWLNFGKKTNAKVFIGIPAHVNATYLPNHYREPGELKREFQSIPDVTQLGGFRLWDISWDQNNIISGKRYHHYVWDILHRVPEKKPTSVPRVKHPKTSLGGLHVTPDLLSISLLSFLGYRLPYNQW